MQKINEAKAKVLYDYLDGQDFFNNPVEHRCRSTMNVTFTSPNPDMDKKFCAEAAEAGFVNLKGPATKKDCQFFKRQSLLGYFSSTTVTPLSPSP